MPEAREQWTATMRDRGLFWREAPDWNQAQIEGAGWTAKRVDGLSQWFVSGDLDAASAAAGGLPSIGLWQIAETSAALLRIGRDRALAVSDKPLPYRSGWNAEGFAASDVSDGWAAIEIDGDLELLVAELTFADLSSGSPSASTLCAGIPALLYRRAEGVARVHVEAPMAAYLWQWLGEAGRHRIG